MKRLKKVQYKRRKENKTDYVARAKLLASGIPRLIIRKSNRYLVAQIVKSKIAQDKVLFTANSKELIKYGWPISKSIKNLAAGYLLGTLVAVKAKKTKVSEVIVDLGLQRSTKGNKVYAVVIGAADSGLKMSYSKKIVPSLKNIEGKEFKNKVNIQEIKEKILKNG